MNITRKTIVVFGVPRSGTSMVAGMLRCLGIYMGERIKPDKHEDLDMLWQPLGVRISTIKKRNAERGVWGWKDPLVGQYINSVGRLLINPMIVYITRDAEDAIECDLRRNPNNSRRYVTARNRALTASMNGAARGKPCIRMTYEGVLADPATWASALAQFIDEPIQAAQIRRAAEFVRPGGYRTMEGV